MSYTRGLRPTNPSSLGDFLDTELLRIQTTFSEVDDAIAAGGGGGGVTDGDKGDIIVSGTGAVYTLDSAVVTAFARTFLDDANAGAVRSTLGLGTLATQSGTFSGTSSGTNTGDQTITLTGPVTGSGTGSFATTITNKAVTLAKMDDVATATVFYRKTAGTGVPEVQTLATLKTDLNLSGTNTGDQTTIAALTTGRTIAITGDMTWTSPSFDGSSNVTAAGTLATVNSNVGSYGSSTAIPVVTVNAKGLVTAVSTATPATGTVELVATSNTISSGLITLSSLSLSSYCKIEIILEDLTAAATLRPWIQVSVGGSFLAATNYHYYHRSGAGSASVDAEGSTGTDAVYLLDVTSTNFQTATSNAAQADLRIINPGGTSHHKQGFFDADNGLGASGVFVWAEGGFRVANTGAIDGFRVGGGTPGSPVSLTNGRVTIIGHKRV